MRGHQDRLGFIAAALVVGLAAAATVAGCAKARGDDVGDGGVGTPVPVELSAVPGATRVDGSDVVLTWTSASPRGFHEYDIYAATTLDGGTPDALPDGGSPFQLAFVSTDLTETTATLPVSYRESRLFRAFVMNLSGASTGSDVVQFTDGDGLLMDAGFPPWGASWSVRWSYPACPQYPGMPGGCTPSTIDEGVCARHCVGGFYAGWDPNQGSCQASGSVLTCCLCTP